MMRKDASEIRQKLLEHGVMLLMDQGYHGTGLQELVQSVGVPKGSFYNYFVSKEAFSAEVVRHYIEPFINRLDFHLGKKGTTAEKALKAYFKELIDDTEQKNFKGGCLLGNLIGEIGETDDLCQIALKEAVHRYRDALKEAIARGQKDGSFRNDLSATQMADVLVNFWQGALLRMKVERSVRPLTQFCDLMLNHYFKEALI
jgi:TetR/AcrR family transcriptional repressor of nem operon